MPPKPTVNRDDILNAAIILIRKHGSDSINARSIAKILNCSTKPLFRVYENMEKLKEDVYGKAVQYYESFLMNIGIDETNAFLSMGINYIQFANKEKELFKYIFLSNNLEIKSLDDLTSSPDMSKLVEYLVVSTGLHEKDAKDLFLELWLLVHGIATLVATNPCTLDNEEIERLLINVYDAIYKHLKLEDN